MWNQKLRAKVICKFAIQFMLIKQFECKLSICIWIFVEKSPVYLLTVISVFADHKYFQSKFELVA